MTTEEITSCLSKAFADQSDFSSFVELLKKQTKIADIDQQIASLSAERLAATVPIENKRIELENKRREFLAL